MDHAMDHAKHAMDATVMAARAMAKKGLMKRQMTLKGFKAKTWVVAVDGSRLSLRALKLAISLKHQKFDKIKVVSVITGDNNDAEKVFKQAKEVLMACGVTDAKQAEYAKLEKDGSIAKTLSRCAENERNAVLVLGAAGRGAENAEGSAGKRAKGQAPLSKMAHECLGGCRTPVLLVHSKAYPTLDKDESMKARVACKPSEGLKMVVTVDGHRISQSCFDLTSQLVRPGDDVDVLHITNSDKAVGTNEHNSLVGTSAIMKYYKDECDKAKDDDQKADAKFTTVQYPKKGGSISNTILNYTEEETKLHGEPCPADLLIMGSAHLAVAGSAGSETLGSVVGAVAQKTQANILVTKYFA